MATKSSPLPLPNYTIRTVVDDSSEGSSGLTVYAVENKTQHQWAKTLQQKWFKEKSNSIVFGNATTAKQLIDATFAGKDADSHAIKLYASGDNITFCMDMSLGTCGMKQVCDVTLDRVQLSETARLEAIVKTHADQLAQLYDTVKSMAKAHEARISELSEKLEALESLSDTVDALGTKQREFEAKKQPSSDPPKTDGGDDEDESDADAKVEDNA